MALVMSLLLTACGEQSQRETSAASEQVEAPKQIISLEEAQSMYKNYSERRVPLIQKYEDSLNRSMRDTASFDVARYTYYDYQTIKQYLAYIEQEAAAAGVEISSLRFYYSNYPDQQTFADGTPIMHPRQNSFFIIPALKQEGEDWAFNIEDAGDGTKRAVILHADLQAVDGKNMGMINNGRDKAYAGHLMSGPSGPVPAAFGNGSVVLNHGGAAPPPWQ